MIFYYSYLGYKTQCKQVPIAFPPQHQPVQPGLEYIMKPRPIFDNPDYIGSCKLEDKVALITGGDSGIGRAVSLAFAKEGANIVIVYFNEHKDAKETKALVEKQGRKCLLIAGDLRKESFCKKIIKDTILEFNKLDILVNNAGVQFPQNSLEDISTEQLNDTFHTNIYPLFYVTKAALPYLKCGATVINTTSITAYQGNKLLIDYSATKGAIVSFTRSLALSLVSKGIRVNGVAPGPIWTPLQPASFDANYITTFGTDTPMKRAGQPIELAPTYVYLASDDSTYVTGQVLHVNGGDYISS
ncbi:SDR family oxidoreductase [Clostridium tyrobutyricum]|uniref:SDR family oxidoreductase n=1 Tax=Clostridium tyrobutyricum TaxID=1519 RepID=UPI000580A01F|nr:SDR family oxidoreductase [Clostridium tyrobutyricum]MBV4414828.1 SDR family oxidoreductase [Clostridium tyrobutyricum]MBV4423620.1 SDR family oxidoreductase [Clostridium tyrobutyricum]MBV4423800.1 SDR family oxidoreductase [Clostridium tyrobutyricum]